jgi:hypothetical protein
MRVFVVLCAKFFDGDWESVAKFNYHDAELIALTTTTQATIYTVRTII